MVFSWLNIAILLALGLGLVFASGPLIGSLALAPSSRGGAFHDPYECGMVPHGSSWVRFGINYYVYALLFLAFDVDVLYLFPVAAYYPNSEGWLIFAKVLLFLFVLGLGCVYFWKKGVFEWPRKISA
jgi:NADH-quinone oxidoreductase subunit A